MTPPTPTTPPAPTAGTGAARRWTPTSAALVLGGMWGLAALGSASTSVVLGDLAADLGLGTAATAWVFTVFALGFAAATPVFGRVADALGPRTPYVVGTGLLALGAVLSAAASTLPLLLAGRAVQGVGAGAIPVLATMILSARFSSEDRAIALGRTNSLVVMLSSAGPLLGGVLGAVGGWRPPFALPLVAVALLPAAVRLAPGRGSGGRVDLRGSALVAATAAVLLGLVQSLGTGGPAVAALGLGLPLLVAATVLHVRARPDGILPVAVSRSAAVTRAAIGGATMPTLYFAALVAVPLELSSRGWTPWENGLLLLPGALAGAAVSFNSAPVLRRLGRRRAAVLGLALAGIGGLVSAGIGMWALLPGVGFVGMAAGYALAQPALAGTVAAAVDEEFRGAALGVFTLSFFVGAGLGSALVGGLGDVLGLSGALGVAATAPLIGVAVLVTARPSSAWGGPGRRAATAVR
ncbi:MAG: MFS transporter [Kineosporiaceae bacterium]